MTVLLNHFASSKTESFTVSRVHPALTFHVSLLRYSSAEALETGSYISSHASLKNLPGSLFVIIILILTGDEIYSPT